MPVPSTPSAAPPSEAAPPPPPQLPPQPAQQPTQGEQTPGETLPPAGTQTPATHRNHHRAHHKTSTPAVTETAPKPVPQPVAPAPPPAPAAPLQLGAMLTPEQRRALVEAIDASAARARHNLSVISIYHLTPSQTETANQIRSFLRQAQATRDSDPEAARSLAERADLLSRDLLKSVQ